MKFFYERPEMEIVEFEAEDVITSSNPNLDNEFGDIL